MSNFLKYLCLKYCLYVFNGFHTCVRPYLLIVRSLSKSFIGSISSTCVWRTYNYWKWPESVVLIVCFFSFRPLLMDSLPPDVEPDESLGPLEVPFPSPDFRHICFQPYFQKLTFLSILSLNSRFIVLLFVWLIGCDLFIYRYYLGETSPLCSVSDGVTGIQGWLNFWHLKILNK